MGVLYGSWHGYVYTSVSRALLFASWQTLGKPYVTQTLGKPNVIVLYRKTLCRAYQYAKSNARETLVYAYPCHQPYSTPTTIGPRETSWRVATSGVHVMALLERFSSVTLDTDIHIGRRGSTRSQLYIFSCRSALYCVLGCEEITDVGTFTFP